MTKTTRELLEAAVEVVRHHTDFENMTLEAAGAMLRLGIAIRAVER